MFSPGPGDDAQSTHSGDTPGPNSHSHNSSHNADNISEAGMLLYSSFSARKCCKPSISSASVKVVPLNRQGSLNINSKAKVCSNALSFFHSH